MSSGRVTGYSEVTSCFNNSELAHAVWRNQYRKVSLCLLTDLVELSIGENRVAKKIKSTVPKTCGLWNNNNQNARVYCAKKSVSPRFECSVTPDNVIDIKAEGVQAAEQPEVEQKPVIKLDKFEAGLNTGDTVDNVTGEVFPWRHTDEG